MTDKQDTIYHKIIEFGVLGLLVFTPLPIGSVYEWSILVIQLVVLLMLGAYVLLRKKTRLNTHMVASFKWLKAAFLGLILFVFFQIIPLPAFIVKVISPGTYGFIQKFSSEPSSIRWMTISLAPHHTLREGLEILTYVLLGFLIIKNITHLRQVKRIIYVIIGMGLFEALFGIIQLYQKSPSLLFYTKDFNLKFVTGTFVNQNHFTGYVEMIIPLVIGLAVARLSLALYGGTRLREKFVAFSERGGFFVFLLLSVLVILCLSVFLARSRSGTFLVALTFILTMEFFMLYYSKAKDAWPVIKRMLQASFLLITIVFIYVGVDASIERFQSEGVFQGNRPQYWRNTTRVIGDFPLFGTGLGTFISVYPAYENTGTYGLLYHAHNDYLEYTSELGLFGSVFLFSGLIFMFIRMFRAWAQRNNPEIKGLALGGIVSILVIAAHSLTDFNLHIPANMILFTVVLSITYVTTHYKYYKKTGQPEKNHRT